METKGAFSGGAFVDDDGTAILTYWMLWGAKGIGLAISKDYNVWRKSRANPVIQSTELGITEMKDAEGTTSMSDRRTRPISGRRKASTTCLRAMNPCWKNTAESQFLT